jgi:hypothetical protein
LDIILQATGKKWSKKQIQDKYKKMVGSEKVSGDAKRIKLLQGTSTAQYKTFTGAQDSPPAQY